MSIPYQIDLEHNRTNKKKKENSEGDNFKYSVCIFFFFWCILLEY